MRTIALFLAAFLLAGCALRLPAAAPALPPPTPTPDAAAAFEAAYADVTAAYNAISAEMARPDLEAAFADPAFRGRVQTLAAEWREAANTVRYMEQPAGDKWAQAWPRITDAMAEFAEVASVTETAARENNPLLLLPGAGKLSAAMALLGEAMGILEE